MSVIIGKALIAGGGGTANRLDFTYTGTYSSQREDGVVEFLDSGVLTFNNSCIIDVFMVGGGGAGNNSTVNSGTRNGGGGAGGITRTYRGLLVKKGTSYPIVIGAGGAVATTQYGLGGSGGDTSAFEQTAPGGTKSDDYAKGGNGGSGGGSGSTASSNSGATGGSDGSNGSGSAGGTGQGTTTREFAEATGKLYAGGGGGGINGTSPNLGGEGGGGNGAYNSVAGAINPVAGEAHTGGGGGGGTGISNGSNNSAWKGAAGGSGIVCIRLHKKSA
jgi:hypothetical protein